MHPCPGYPAEIVCCACNCVDKVDADGNREPVCYCVNWEVFDGLSQAFSEETDDFGQPTPAVQRGQELLHNAKLRRQESSKYCQQVSIRRA